MRKLEKINQSIHEGIISNYYSRMIDWYKIKEFTNHEKEFYEIKFYLNYLTEEKDLIKFQDKLNEILEAIEDNVLFKIDKEFIFTSYIDTINIIDNIVEIVVIAESVNNKRKEYIL